MREEVHVLKANGATSVPFADETYCGKSADDNISAMWPGDRLVGVHWGKPYRINGRWCVNCRKAQRAERRR